VVSQIDTADKPSGMSWSPDGDLLAASICHYGTFVWRVSTGQQVAELSGDASVAWHPSGSILATGSTDRWTILNRSDWSTQREVSTSAGAGWPGALAWRPDGAAIAVADGDSVIIWNADGTERQSELRGHRNPVASVSWSPDGRRLVTADKFRDIKLWDVGAPIQPPEIETGKAVRRLAWAADDSVVTEPVGDRRIAYWNAVNGLLIRQKSVIVNVDDFTLSPNFSLAATYSENSHAFVISETETAEPYAKLKLDSGHMFDVSSLWENARGRFEFSPDSSLIAVTTGADTFRFLEVWNIEAEQRVAVWKSATPWLGRLTWAPSGTLLAAIGGGDAGDSVIWPSHLHVIDPHTGERLSKNFFTSQTTGTTAVAWSTDETLIAMGSADGQVQVASIPDGTAVFNRKVQSTSITGLAWHPSKNRLACATLDGQIILLSASEGKELLRFSFKGQGGAIDQLAWSGDGQRLAAANRQGKVHVYDATHGYEFSPPGRREGELAWAYVDRAVTADKSDRPLAWQKVLEMAPDSREFWLLRGRVWAVLNNFGRGEEEFAKCVVSNHVHSFHAERELAICVLAQGDLARYRQVCSRFIQEWGKGPVDSNTAWTADLVSLVANNDADARKLMTTFITGWIESDYDPDKAIRGACLFRDGQFQEAARVLGDLSNKLAAGGDLTDPLLNGTQYFLSMARYALGEKLPARRILIEAHQRYAAATRPLGNMYDWQRRVILSALRKEAEATIGLTPDGAPDASE
jgi:WD40 repeat protein